MRKGARVYLHDEDGQTCISHAALLGEHALVIDMATAGELPVHLGAPTGSPCAALCEEPLCGLPSWARMERGTAGNHTAQPTAIGDVTLDSAILLADLAATEDDCFASLKILF